MKSAPLARDICLLLFISPLCVAPTRPGSYCAGRHPKENCGKTADRLVAFLNKGAGRVAPSCPMSPSDFHAEQRDFQELENLTVKMSLNSGRISGRGRVDIFLGGLMRGAAVLQADSHTEREAFRVHRGKIINDRQVNKVD